MTDEYLTAIRQFWTEDEVDFDGKYVSYNGVATAPRPVRKPHPPIWVGGASDAALRRTVRLGDAWHPIRFQEGWFRDEGIPRLKAIAAEEGAAMPALCPRIRLRLFDTPLDDSERIMGNGTAEQIHRDLAALEELGCEHVLLDTYYDDIEASKNVEASWRTLAQVAETMIDLSTGTVR